MADFLNRLAARALGTTPVAEPVIPSRFSSGPEQSAFLPAEPAFQPAPPSPQTYSQTSEGRPRPLPIREADPRSENHAERLAAPFQDIDEPPHRPLPQRPNVIRPQPSPPPFAERDTAQPSAERTEVRSQHLAAATDPLRQAMENDAHKPQTTPRTSAPFAEPQPTPRLTAPAEPVRSPQSQRPEVAQSLRPAPPTVHVSIGRIEVRAEITAPAPRAPAQRPRPSTLSLDQFLKQAGRGR